MNTELFNRETLTKLSRVLLQKKLTVAVAESCTSGLIQNAFSQAEEATSLFHGGITVYNAGQKSKHLNVNFIAAEKCNSVSQDISDRMALEVAKMFNAEIGIAITGYAQPIPEDNIHTCFAYISVSLFPDLIVSRKITGDAQKTLQENQLLFADKILKETLRVLQ